MWWLPVPTKLNSLVCTSYKLPGTLSLSVAGTVGLRTLFELQEVCTMAASHSGRFGKAYREVVVLALKVCGFMLDISVRESEADLLKGWRIVLYSCHICGPLHKCLCLLSSCTNFIAWFVCCSHSLTHDFK